MDKQYLIVVSSEEKELKWVFRIKEELYLKEAKFTNKYYNQLEPSNPKSSKSKSNL